MISNVSPLLNIALYISFALLFAGLFLTFLRLLKGPSLPDRVLAIDLFTMFVMGTIVLYSALTGLTIYLNAVFVMAFIAFMGTVAFARYIEKGARE